MQTRQRTFDKEQKKRQDDERTFLLEILRKRYYSIFLPWHNTDRNGSAVPVNDEALKIFSQTQTKLRNPVVEACNNEAQLIPILC